MLSRSLPTLGTQRSALGGALDSANNQMWSVATTQTPWPLFTLPGRHLPSKIVFFAS